MATVRPTSKNIAFKFEDEVVGGMFADQSKGGIYIGRNYSSNAETHRWGKILAVGPDVKTPELVVGARVFIEAMRWTEGMKVGDDTIWFTNEDSIIGVENEGE